MRTIYLEEIGCSCGAGPILLRGVYNEYIGLDVNGEANSYAQAKSRANWTTLLTQSVVDLGVRKEFDLTYLYEYLENNFLI